MKILIEISENKFKCPSIDNRVRTIRTLASSCLGLEGIYGIIKLDYSKCDFNKCEFNKDSTGVRFL